ncbi:MAG TPA: PQQ-binding-like beta-propeller repeat protein [Bryobacteraceae bacterium]|jgi:polyvinyl alcohol dehydrogenase (cytochrome)
MKSVHVSAALLLSMVSAVAQPPAVADPGHCSANPQLGDLTLKPSWNGWGAGISNLRRQGSAAAQLNGPWLGELKLKWAFGFPGAKGAPGLPTVAGGRVFAGADTGDVYSLDAATGCVYWSYHADAGVRAAITIGRSEKPGESLVYFGDLKANVYAIDADTGAEVWKVSVDAHAAARITGSPQLYEDRLYVPVSSLEEVSAADPAYACCTFRGSVAALDAQSGHMIWQTFIIPDAPKPTTKNAKDTQQFGPSGGGVWNSPTVDPKRRALYVGTGDAYTQPAPKTTDSIVALGLDDGRMLWSVEDTPNDAWVTACIARANKENCPQDAGPDYDFGSSPMLIDLHNGKSLLIAGQKSGIVWAHDPDRKGAVVWKTSVSATPPEADGEIVWGGTADDSAAYFGVRSGGVVSVALENGERGWVTPIKAAPGRRPGQDAAVSSIPGYIFSNGWDGVLRILSSGDGKIVWSFDTVQEFKTVSGVPAKGGVMSSAGPSIAGGMIFAGAGTVLLAFGVE